MKKLLSNTVAVVFLVLFLPYTMTLLINGKQGIHREEELPALEYQVLSCLMSGDHAWMEDGTLDLMAILYRTECVRAGVQEEEKVPEVYEEAYGRMYDAVMRTRGQVITIDGEYKELPYHAVSSGRTREGRLLGESYAYALAVDCPCDRESEEYLHIYRVSVEGLLSVLGTDSLEDMNLVRDDAGYVTHIEIAGKEWQGEAFRSLLHLSSSCFYMDTDTAEGEVQITVKGSGHGFGLSLRTADYMVREGMGIPEIIQTFYQNAACITIP